MRQYTEEIREEAIKRLAAGLSPEVIAGQLSISVSGVRSIAKAAGVSASAALTAASRDIREVLALPEEKQNEYFHTVMRTAALKVATIVENMSADQLLNNVNEVTKLASWARGVVGGSEKPPPAPSPQTTPMGRVNLSLLLRKTSVVDAEVLENEATPGD